MKLVLQSHLFISHDGIFSYISQFILIFTGSNKLFFALPAPKFCPRYRLAFCDKDKEKWSDSRTKTESERVRMRGRITCVRACVRVVYVQESSLTLPLFVYRVTGLSALSSASGYRPTGNRNLLHGHARLGNRSQRP